MSRMMADRADDSVAVILRKLKADEGSAIK